MYINGIMGAGNSEEYILNCKMDEMPLFLYDSQSTFD